MTRRLVVEADGGSRGNPGPAGYGALVAQDDGTVLAEVCDVIGHATNNVAEYRGLIAGLQAARDLDAGAAVEARLDSKLVVEQVSGRWQVKNATLRPLAREAAALLGSFPAGAVARWVPRAQNARADALANAAMDGRTKPWPGAAAAGAGAADGGGSSTARAPVGPSPDDRVRPEVVPAPPEPDPDATSPARAGRGSGWTPAGVTSTRTLLLRHGATALTASRRFSGRGDAELAADGHAQARAAATRLARDGGVDAVVTSPLARARATATACADALRVPLSVDDDLVEADFGRWEGLTFGEVSERHPRELAAWLADPSVAPPGGEAVETVARRVTAARERAVAAHEGGVVLLVSHVTPVKTLLRQALEAPSSVLYRLHLDACSLSVVDWYGDGRASVRLVNDTAHLQRG